MSTLVAHIQLPDDLKPGSQDHLMQVACNYLRSKGIATEQIWDDGIPRFRIIVKLEQS